MRDSNTANGRDLHRDAPHKHLESRSLPADAPQCLSGAVFQRSPYFVRVWFRTAPRSASKRRPTSPSWSALAQSVAPFERRLRGGGSASLAGVWVMSKWIVSYELPRL
eukprot:818443-Alexandrium_andersonii.AAC.1